jgi:DNA-binding NarL/FixJ family response regulator
MGTKILIADDHGIVRASLKALLDVDPEIEVVGEAGDGRAVIDQVDRHRPSVVLMDIAMSGLNGIEATRQISKQHPSTRVIVLSMHEDQRYVIQAMRAGAAGYISKSSAAGELRLAIDAVARGEVFLSPAISRHVLDAAFNPRGDIGLEEITPRQREVLQLVAEGHSSKEIAQILKSSVKTVEAHRANLMGRLDIHDVAGLVRYAVRHGLVSVEH